MDEARADEGGEQPDGEFRRRPGQALRSRACSPIEASRGPYPGPPPVRTGARLVPEPAAPQGDTRWMRTPASPADVGGQHGDLTRWRCRQISHDIHHELGTISLLATLLSTAPDIGHDSRARALLILREIRWLDQLHRAYEECLLGPVDRTAGGPSGNIRLDLIAGEVVEAIALTSTTRIDFSAEELTAYTDRLAFWRVLRNLVQNAVRSAGPSGTVQVRISAEAGWAVAQIDDDGPGFSAMPPRPGSRGLGIVHDLATVQGGGLEIGRSGLGGGCVRLRVPTAPPPGRPGVEGQVR